MEPDSNQELVSLSFSCSSAKQCGASMMLNDRLRMAVVAVVAADLTSRQFQYHCGDMPKIAKKGKRKKKGSKKGKGIYFFSRSSAGISHNSTSNAVHGSFHIAPHLVPICSSLGEFVDLFYAPDAMEAICVGDYRREFFGVGGIDQIDLRELSEGLEVEQEVLVSECLDEFEIVVHVTFCIRIVPCT